MKGDSGEATDIRASEAIAPPVGFRELGRWFAPWLCGGLLAAISVFGLISASAAADAGGEAAGFITFGLATIALARGIKNYCGGVGFFAPFFVEDATSLAILALCLAGLAVAGLVLAARAGDAVWQCVGYALFVASLAVLAGSLKHYFDRRDAETAANGS